MLLRVIGKRNKERALPLTKPTLAMLREVWKIHRSSKWLFPNRKGTDHLSNRMARRAFHGARDACGYDRRRVPPPLPDARPAKRLP
jgi:integrase